MLKNGIMRLIFKDIGILFNEKTDESKIFCDSINLFNNNSNLMKNSQLYYFKFYLPMVLRCPKSLAVGLFRRI